MITGKIRIGVIADDFTGASDAASFLEKSGVRTIMYTAIPKELQYTCDAIVMALKIRSVKPEWAVSEVKEAVDFFKRIGCEKIYFKYCSTFDSTPRGNIGVVADFLLDYLNETYTVLCPSLPINKRTVKDGILYVDGVQLSESPLKDHPLNPMWDSYIGNLMKPQSKYPCFLMKQEDFLIDTWQNRIQAYKHENEKFYIIPDYETDQDGALIAERFKDLKVLTGASGLLAHIQPTLSHVSNKMRKHQSSKSILLCGSCSLAARQQVSYYQKHGGACYPVNAEKIMNNTFTVHDLFIYVEQQVQPVLIYSDAIDQDMRKLKQKDNFQAASKLIERTMGEISFTAMKKGYNRIIVAGGETSGAVTQYLGFTGFYIGKSIDPGVPELIPLKDENMTIVLKSGNFGAEDFFVKAAIG